MCGRYVLLRPDIRALLKRLRLEDLVSGLTSESRYNIGPGQTVLGVRPAAGGIGLEGATFTWGMEVPSVQSPGRTQFLINARSESVAKSPTFREALAQGRCVLPASGFYEWGRGAGGSQPWLFRFEGDEPFFLAGLCSMMPGGAGERCVVLTTAANERLSAVHDRMPVLFTPEEAQDWLGPQGASPEARRRLLRPYPTAAMKAERVGDFVSNIRNEGPGCWAPWSEPAGRQTELPL